MRVGTALRIKNIASILGKTVVCLIFTSLVVGLVVVRAPKDPVSYVALSFALLLDAILIRTMLPTKTTRKYKPKTIPKHLVFWLGIVLYCCAVAVALLINAYFQTEKHAAKVVVLVFSCLFAGMGATALGALLFEFVGYLQIRSCLKHGTVTTAEFAGRGKKLRATQELTKTREAVVFTGYAVFFRYTDGEGTLKTAKSKCVFSYDETERLEKAGTFSIRYNARRAVVAETFAPQDEEALSPVDGTSSV